MLSGKLKIIFCLAIVGTIFASLVTARQFISPATEPGVFSCVGLSIYGLSPCPYGLTIYIFITLISGLILYKQKELINWLRLISFGGVIFSGWVAWREICLPALQKGPLFWETFSIARVPACVWGFFVFVIIFILSLQLKSTKPTVAQV